MKKKLIGLSSLVGFAPFVALAQNATGCDSVELGTVQSIICKFGNILDTLIPVLIVLGVVYFVWGVVQYVISSEEEAKQKGKMRMIYGIIGLVVIVAMWGLVGIVKRTFDLDQPTNISIPTVPF
ncbi:MAG: hypothetical protein UR62_C0005G0021 [Candidatus Nomurabacteria bacterium GW2011_GWF2_35_12]|uniref:TrbC/VIRB2 family protein n=3 Tax=Candidatus Nomuraibacteriota TaxID=1752729 RepID=A0A0G0DYY4_9BACT|nr:MAG: hypothetical protein UR62_C0005G0021 [Candidatus Nomurabacteria bacterium GW2011_GWF2_35_12]KKP72420.1 MAG: hypothetical protein UR70_C0008G0012 [Candidatus Nomurabacteria bacterium GW2011_GWB1_35_20]KKP75124.1 MAG: hypothetical protein UR72_C0006G0020 [Parcubacteria group bacterium GW2011_GWC1_35_21]KKP78245.1 MAG: hypothetical protein UR77_C0005G0020 [Candidatus Nomurabacteria bacterium GW2011_GWC2_35_35]KKP85343.1 MAG: hypothetical protein UR86_C0007G0005 [Parcubacteria group bacteri